MISAKTKSQSTYVKLWTRETESRGAPASIKQATIDSAVMRCSGSTLFTDPSEPSDVWVHLERQGGQWMWKVGKTKIVAETSHG